MMRKSKHYKIIGYLFAICATAIWSGNFIVARGLHQSIPPISLAFWRWFVAVVVFLPFALKNLIDEWDSLRKNIIYLSITALLGITIFNTLIYFAGRTTTAINLSLISLSFPIFIIILSRIFFKELMTVKKGIGILIVITGVLLLITRGDFSNLMDISFAIGDIWMLIAAIIFAIYSILVKNKPENISIRAFQLSTFILGLIFLFPFFIWEQVTYHFVNLSKTTVLAILYVGIFASFTAFVLWNKSIVMIGPSKAGMIYYALPVFSGILAHLFLDENISTIHFFSMLLIFSGIIISNRKSKVKPKIVSNMDGDSSGPHLPR